MSLKPPAPNPRRDLLRAALEALAQFTPVTAALTRLYQTTHPSQFEQEVASWRHDASEAINDTQDRVRALEEAHQPKLKLTPAAQALAEWLALTSEKGLEDPVEFEDIKAAFPETPQRDLQEAAAELEMYGLASISTAIGHPVLRVTPAVELFAIFDPVVLGTSPQSDAVELAKAALELDSGHAPELEAKLRWPKRRLNPALALLLTLVAPGRVRRVIQADYVTLGFILAAEERVRFRALIAAADS
jgi:hypothetical protein